MTKTDGMLRHLAFFEELGAMDESDAGWRSVSAGLVVMRLVDRWMLDGAHGLSAHGVNAVRSAIEEMPETTPVRRILSAVVDAMLDAQPGEMHAVTPRLMAYGQALEYESKYRLAADVYSTIVRRAHPTEDADIALLAQTRLGASLLHLGDLSASAAAYDEASHVAVRTNDIMGLLRAQVGRAKVWIALGNAPQAETILDDAIVRASAPGLEDACSRALHERAYVAALRGQYERTIQFAYQALELSTSPREQERILCDVAAGFMDLGVLAVARDAYLVIVATAQEQYVRWAAELNLMEIAAREGVEPQFDRYRRELEHVELPPQLAVTYYIHVGRGFDSFGRVEESIENLERAVRMAHAFKYNQLLFEAENALIAARQRRPRPRTPVGGNTPPSVREVAEHIQAMKRLAGVA